MSDTVLHARSTSRTRAHGDAYDVDGETHWALRLSTDGDTLAILAHDRDALETLCAELRSAIDAMEAVS